MVQFHVLPSPPGQVQAFGPVGGELFEEVLSWGEEGGENRKYLLFVLAK